MNKSLIALAVLGAFAGAASAQSSVTLYGRVDLAIGKQVGAAPKYLGNGSGSRFGVRGVEDLGGGLQALFQIEHRFDADTGGSQNFCIAPAGVTVPAGACGPANRFWGARSIVGLQGSFGQFYLGREYTTAFLGSQLVADPWGWDTVVGATPGVGLSTLITGGQIARVRNDSAATYKFSASGFSFGAQIAEATDSINSFQSKPLNFALGYAAGPLNLGFGYERTGQEAAAVAKWMSFNGTYDLGVVKLGGFVGRGTTTANSKNKSYALTATAPVGAGEFRFLAGKLSSKSVAGVSTDLAKGFAAGYHYSLSKRTTLYTDFVRNSGTTAGTYKTGYDLGLKHNF